MCSLNNPIAHSNFYTFAISAQRRAMTRNDAQRLIYLSHISNSCSLGISFHLGRQTSFSFFSNQVNSQNATCSQGSVVSIKSVPVPFRDQ